MGLGLQAIVALFIVLSYLWTIWCYEMARTNKEKKLILISSRYFYILIWMSAWFIQLMDHNTIIYWRIVELFK
jgi:hypothetical protein